MLQYIDFVGVGNLLYYYSDILSFTTIEKGFNFNNFYKRINYGKNNCKYIFIYLYVVADTYFETFSFLKSEKNITNNNGNYIIFDNKDLIRFKYDQNMSITLKQIDREDTNFYAVIRKSGLDYSYKIKDGYRLFLESDKEIKLVESSGLIIIHLEKQVEIYSIQFFCFSNNYNYVRIIIPYVRDNYNFTFYKGYAFTESVENLPKSNISKFYSNNMKEDYILLNSNKEIRLYLKNIALNGKYDKNYPYEFIYSSYYYGFFYPRYIKAYAFTSIYDYPANIFSSGYNFFSLPGIYNIYKCSNTELVMHIENNHTCLFSEVVNNSGSFNFSEYDQNDVLEIEANADFLIIGSQCYLENYQIKNLNGEKEYNDTKVLLDYEKPISCPGVLKYIFAPKSEYLTRILQDECYIYNFILGKIEHEYILITTENDFEKILEQKYKEYLVTIVYDGNDYEPKYPRNIIIYKPTTIKVSQALLDQVLSPPKPPKPEDKKSDSDSKINTIIIISIILGFMLLLFIALILILKYRKKRKINDASKINEKVSEMKDLNLNI